MDHAVTIALIRRPKRIVFLGPATTRRVDTARGEPGERPVFKLLKPDANLEMISVREHRSLQTRKTAQKLEERRIKLYGWT